MRAPVFSRWRIVAWCTVLAATLLIAAAVFRLAPSIPVHNAAPGPYRLQDYTIRFDRGPCLGDCPAFVLTVHGNGQAVLEGHGFRKGDEWGERVPWRLVHTIDPAMHHGLVDTLETGRFRELEAEYSVLVSDMSDSRVTVRSPRGDASVLVYAVPCASEAARMSGSERAQWAPDGPVPDVFCTLRSQLFEVACEVFQHARPRDPTILVPHPPRCPRHG